MANEYYAILRRDGLAFLESRSFLVEYMRNVIHYFYQDKHGNNKELKKPEAKQILMGIFLDVSDVVNQDSSEGCGDANRSNQAGEVNENTTNENTMIDDGAV
eukprot:5644389-Ditylum_brightwellii.AAC.1